METSICRLQGLDVPSVKYPAYEPEKLPPQSPELKIEHEVIGQLVLSVLLKNKSQVVNPVTGVIKAEPPEA